MALIHSPSIVTSGLVLALDAANVRSYPGSGTSWFDLSGNGNTGTLTNGPTFNSSNLGGISFDGGNDYVNATSYTGHQTAQGTLEAVVRLSTNSGDRYVIGVGGTTTFGASRAIRVNGGTWSTVSYGSSTEDFNSIVAAPTGTWMHVIFGWSGTSIFFYLNGTLYQATRSGMITPTGTILRVGNPPWDTSATHHGEISIARHYNRLLTTTEVLQN